MNLKKNICCNCDEVGHDYKNCPIPKTSWGIILINISNIEIEHNDIDLNEFKSNLNLKSAIDLEIMSKIMNSIQFLTVQRKHSLGYVEFISGRYKIDNIDGIKFLFQQMVPEEINKLAEIYDKDKNQEQDCFKLLWTDFWHDDINKVNNNSEYRSARSKFYQLKNCTNNVDLPLKFYIDKIKSTYKTLEWGFPKGRRIKNESTLDCALREFEEETGININKIKIIKEIKPIVENLIGTNGIKYRHIYYIAELIDNIDIKHVDLSNVNSEISSVGFFGYNDLMLMIRDYHVAKKEILNKIMLYYVGLLINAIHIKNNKK